MTKEHARTLTQNIEEAKTNDERDHAVALAIVALVDCQSKTADRVKLVLKIAYGVAGFCVLYSIGGSELVVKLLKLVGLV